MVHIGGNTPGPGGFGPSFGFGRPHPGVTAVPARVRTLPGVYSGQSAAVGVHPWFLLGLAVLVLLVGAVVIRRR